MDAAKAVAMLATNEGGIEPYQMEGKPIAAPALPFFAVPTTSGTGSEATKVSVVYNPKNHLKKSFYDRSMIGASGGAGSAAGGGPAQGRYGFHGRGRAQPRH